MFEAQRRRVAPRIMFEAPRITFKAPRITFEAPRIMLKAPDIMIKALIEMAFDHLRQLWLSIETRGITCCVLATTRWGSQNCSEHSCDNVMLHSIIVCKIWSPPNRKWSSLVALDHIFPVLFRYVAGHVVGSQHTGDNRYALLSFWV